MTKCNIIKEDSSWCTDDSWSTWGCEGVNSSCSLSQKNAATILMTLRESLRTRFAEWSKGPVLRGISNYMDGKWMFIAATFSSWKDGDTINLDNFPGIYNICLFSAIANILKVRTTWELEKRKAPAADHGNSETEHLLGAAAAPKKSSRCCQQCFIRAANFSR